MKNLTARIHNLPLRQKLLFSLMTTSITALALACSIFVINYYLTARNNLLSEAVALTETLANSSTAALAFDDKQGATEILQALKAHPAIDMAALYRQDGSEIAFYLRNGATGRPRSLDSAGAVLFTDNNIHIYRPVSLESEPIGRIYLRYNLSALTARQWRFLTLVVIVLALVSCVTFFIASRLMRYISGPVQNLVEVAEAVTRKQDYSIRAEHFNSDEIGTLSDSFNNMLTQIEERDRQLVTHYEQLEEQVALRTSELKTANTAKSQFLATMSHEIRTPLNALIGFSTLARKTTDRDKLDQYLDILEQSAESLMLLFNDILDMSKLEAERMTLENRPLNLHRFFTTLEEQYSPLALNKKLAFRLSVADNIPAWVITDTVRLRQIFVNLLSNALKFTETGSIGCNVRLAGHNLNDDRALIRIEVQDSGIGIPEEQHCRLFQPFHQLDPSVTRRFGGSGLGLAIVNNLVQMMNGTITVESREGVGSSFIIEMPLQEGEALPDENTLPQQLPSAAFLVVEDNAFNRRLLEDILSSRGGRVTIAEDGLQALQLIEERHFDVILLDIRMPGIDGIEVARRIRLREQELSLAAVHIIAVTADTDTATREACIAAGINAVLAKPVSEELLVRVIAAHDGMALTAVEPEVVLNLQAHEGLGNDPERTRLYLEMLLQDIDDELQCLTNCLETGDRANLERGAHTLKGLCVHLANQEPAELAAWLQQSAATARLELLRPVVIQLSEMMKRSLPPGAEDTPILKDLL